MFEGSKKNYKHIDEMWQTGSMQRKLVRGVVSICRRLGV